MKIKIIFACALLMAVRLSAQVVDVGSQTDSSAQRRQLEASARATLQPGDTAAESYAGEASDVGPQTVIRYPKRHNWVQASADLLYYHTDNMFLLDNFRQEANVLLSTVEINFTPPGWNYRGGEFFPRFGYRHQWYNFGAFGGDVMGSAVNLDTFDFHAGTAFGELNWQRGGWNLGGGFDYVRLVGTSSGDEFYSEYIARLNAGYTWRLCPKSTFTLRYDGDYRWSNPSGTYLLSGRSDFDRTDHALGATLNFTLCPRAVLQPYYRYKFTSFSRAPSRDDHTHTLGLGVYLPVCDNFGVRLYAAWEMRDGSGGSANDYTKTDLGAGVNVSFRF